MKKSFTLTENGAHAKRCMGAKMRRGIVGFYEMCFGEISPNPLLKKNFSLFTSHFSREGKRVAFTLAEVLITLGIIGVVAAITLPAIHANIQKVVLKNQLKKFVTNFYNGIKQVKANTYPEIGCYYWDVNPYSAAGNPSVCAETNEYGTCTSWKMQDGSNLASNYNGNLSDCEKFHEELFNNVFKTIKFCKNKALTNGCIYDEFRGVDKVKSEQNPNKEQDPNQDFSTSRIKNSYTVWVLVDGTIVIKYWTMASQPLYVIDVNGAKGPNKWGYDIFAFYLIGNEQLGIHKLVGKNYATEKGGTSSSKMFESLFQ